MEASKSKRSGSDYPLATQQPGWKTCFMIFQYVTVLWGTMHDTREVPGAFCALEFFQGAFGHIRAFHDAKKSKKLYLDVGEGIKGFIQWQWLVLV